MTETLFNTLSNLKMSILKEHSEENLQVLEQQKAFKVVKVALLEAHYRHKSEYFNIMNLLLHAQLLIQQVK